MEIDSRAFRENERIPHRHARQTQNVSPPLRWYGVPERAQELVLLMVDDTDAGAPVVHWLVYGISPRARDLPAGMSERAQPGGPITQGQNAFGHAGYDGPSPGPGRRHHYRFRLYALDEPLELEPGAGFADVRAKMEGHVLSEANYPATYAQPRTP